MDFGVQKRLKILCISETCWHDTATLLADTKDAGGKDANHYDIKRVGCNHCTGENAVRRMIELGLPTARGSARHGSKMDADGAMSGTRREEFVPSVGAIGRTSGKAEGISVTARRRWQCPAGPRGMLTRGPHQQ